MISGVTGHLGRVLGAQLVAAGFEVHGLTRQLPDRSVPSPDLRQIHLHRLDGQTATLCEVMSQARPDVVFHLAAMVRSEHRGADIAPLVEANILHGTQLLEAMRASGCSRVITAGSYLQHGDTEDFRALNLYAATKQAFECLLEYYADAYNFSAVRLTVCNIYGERQSRPSLAGDIAIACRRSSPLTLRNPHVRVDLVHVDDVARAFVRMVSLLGSEAAPYGRLSRYSVTSGSDLSAGELVGLFERIGRMTLAVECCPLPAQARRVNPWRGKVVPGWAPRISIEEGISRLLADQPN
jgi:nucleoside-diphosphate-sugar epimerase